MTQRNPNTSRDKEPVPVNRRNPEITSTAVLLLRQVVAAPWAEFVALDTPAAKALMQHGYMVRTGTKWAQITPTGRAFLAGVDHAATHEDDR